jgi:regulator of replication initiation timing
VILQESEDEKPKRHPWVSEKFPTSVSKFDFDSIVFENSQLRLENERFREQVASNETLLAAFSLNLESNEILNELNHSYSVVDQLRQEKFNLKRQLAYEKHKYNEIKNTFMELKQEQYNSQYDL